MKFAQFSFKGKGNYGLIEKQRIVVLPTLAETFKTVLPSTLEDFISTGKAKETAELLIVKSNSSQLEKASIPLSEVDFLAPITSPPKIICLGLNYLDHISETKSNLPEEPVLFMKPRTAIIGPNQKIIKRSFVKELDYEGELAIVIGKRAKDVPESEASKYIFGYTILNDVSARDFQFKDTQWTRGKGFDTFAPIGPNITTAEELIDPEHLRIRTWVNGELRQNGSTQDMIFKISQIIYHLSRVMTLEPCDIISTGTPSGVGMSMKPQKWLKDSDVVRVEIDKIGVLENTVKEI